MLPDSIRLLLLILSTAVVVWPWRRRRRAEGRRCSPSRCSRSQAKTQPCSAAPAGFQKQRRSIEHQMRMRSRAYAPLLGESTGPLSSLVLLHQEPALGCRERLLDVLRRLAVTGNAAPPRGAPAGIFTTRARLYQGRRRRSDVLVRGYACGINVILHSLTT